MLEIQAPHRLESNKQKKTKKKNRKEIKRNDSILDGWLKSLFLMHINVLFPMNLSLIVYNHCNVMLIFHFYIVLLEYFFSYPMLSVLYSHLYVIESQPFEYDSNLVHEQLQVDMLPNVSNRVH